MINGSDIPAGYERVKYLESSGSQYINTLEKLTYNTEVYVRFNSFGSGIASIISIARPGYFTAFGIIQNSKEIYQGMLYNGIRTEEISTSLSKNQLATIKMNRHEMVVNETIIYKFSVEMIDPTPFNGHLYLFSVGSINYDWVPAFDYLIGIVEFCTISDGNLILKDFVPVLRNSDSKPGMYDTITQTFFTNQGTGEFGYEKLDGTYVAPI